MTVDASAERAHEPGPADWQEHWHVELVTDTGLALFARLTCWPAAATAWWWTALVAPDLPGPVLVRAPDLTLPRPGTLEVRGDGVWADLVCETPLEHWSVGLEAFGVRLDTALDALRDERGERLPVGLDLEWETAGAPVGLPGAAPGYAQLGTVHGELLLGAATIPIDARGVRTHDWGVARWWSAPTSLLTVTGPERLLLADAGECVRWEAPAPDGEAVAVARGEHHTDAAGLPAASRLVLADATELVVDVEAVAPLVVDAPDGRRAALHRAVCRVAARATTDEVTDPDDPGVGLVGWFDRSDPALASL